MSDDKKKDDALDLFNEATKEEKEALREYNLLLGDVREVMKLAHGRRVIWHILSFAEIYSVSQGPVEKVNFREGRRSVGIDICDLLDAADPALYPQLLTEGSRKK